MENSILKKILEWSICVIVAVIIALLIRYYLVAPTMIKQTSMNPTLKEGERVVLNRTTRIFENEYKRGQIVTFEAPTNLITNANKSYPIAIYAYNPSNFWEKIKYKILELNKVSYIKRIIAIEGDRIQIKDGKVYLNNYELKEEYLEDATQTSCSVYNDIIVPEGHVYVMGDNRNESMDSRTFGCIPIEKIEGTVWFRYWPLSEFEEIY